MSSLGSLLTPVNCRNFPPDKCGELSGRTMKAVECLQQSAALDMDYQEIE
jgi:hypothetical protein